MWLPQLTARNIPPGDNDPKFIPIGVIWHVRAGRGKSLYDYFNGPSGGIEATGYIRYDGTGEQYRDTDYSIDAQAAGNWWIGSDGKKYGYLAFETEGVCGEEWTPQQLTCMTSISRTLHDRHNIPYRMCRNAKDPGHGYHSLFSAWNPHLHSCPCKERVAQFPSFIMNLEPPTNPPAMQGEAPPDMIGYEVQGRGFFVPGGDRDANGRTKLYHLPAEETDQDPQVQGSFRDYRNAGVTFVKLDANTLKTRGFAVQTIDF